MMMFADCSRGTPYTKDPAVVNFAGKYFLYCSLPPFNDGRKPDGWRIGIASSANLTDWKIIAELQPEQECEANGLTAPGAIVLNDQVHLFYQTYGNGSKDAICHAVSNDGINFRRNPENPVWHPQGKWTCGRAIDADVVAHDGKLYLYAATRDPEMKIQMITGAVASLASSFGCRAWTQLGNGPLLKPELPWEQECIEAPALCRREGKFFMFYGGAYNNKPQQIGCACSTDGIVWERLQNTPFLPNGKTGEWNSSESGHPFVFVDNDDRVYLFYQGNADMGRSWYLSQVELVWRKGCPEITTS